MLFALNADLLPGENISAVTAQAEDAQLTGLSTHLEFVEIVPVRLAHPVIVRLPDSLPTNREFLVSITLRGKTSNKARFRIQEHSPNKDLHVYLGQSAPAVLRVVSLIEVLSS